MSTDSIDAAIAAIKATAWQAPSAGVESNAQFGAYTGLPPTVTLLADGRNGTLVNPITYRDMTGLDWPVPAGSALDGASIPRAFWTLIGGPFEGKYRDASIVHDHYCVSQDRSWRSTARMFYQAMRCSDVPPIKAKIMFYAVFRFGPHWPDPLESSSTPAEPLEDRKAPSLLADVEAIAGRDPSLSEIEAMAIDSAAAG